MFGGEKKADCPLWKSACKEHACRWYIQVHGKNPQSDEIINRWDCAIAWLPVLLIENSQKQHQTGCEINHLRNEVTVSNAQTRNALIDAAYRIGGGGSPSSGGNGNSGSLLLNVDAPRQS